MPSVFQKGHNLSCQCENCEKVKQNYYKQYYKNRKIDFLELVTCSCGLDIQRINLNRHQKTKLHQKKLYEGSPEYIKAQLKKLGILPEAYMLKMDCLQGKRTQRDTQLLKQEEEKQARMDALDNDPEYIKFSEKIDKEIAAEKLKGYVCYHDPSVVTQKTSLAKHKKQCKPCFHFYSNKK